MPAESFIVSREEAARTVAEVLRRRLRLSWSQARHLVEVRRVRLSGQLCVDPARRVKPGQRLEVLSDSRGTERPGRTYKTVGPQPTIRYMDEQVVVVDKPPGLTTMRHPEEVAEFGSRARRFLPPTLADLLPALLAKSRSKASAGSLLPVHRLDKETSGLVVFARTALAARHLGQQFRAHTIDRCYWALVRGKARSGRIESYLTADRGDGRRGSTENRDQGKRAVTNVRAREELGEYTLVECRLETGRTHQIRIHLGEQGTPLCGDHVYDRPPHGTPRPDESKAPRPMLHAARLGFEHPRTGKKMTWEAPPPGDMARLLRRLRKHSPRAGHKNEE
jgi:23S rRNA pseudouridine1911/1915/1917 synthase